MAKIKINPEVRFADFSENWEERELSKILTERKVMQKIAEDAPILAFAAGQGVIDRSERKSNNRDHLTHDQENKIYKLTELNDIVYNPSNLKYGAIDRNKHGRGVISPIYVTFTTEEEPSFIELLVKNEKFKLRALQYEEGTVVKRQSVKPQNLLSLKVNISPSKDEQKQIGVLFEQIENLISHYQAKYNNLIIMKKALLDKMFPKSGKNVPEIRFGSFKDKWKNTELSQIVDLRSGSDYKHLYKGEIPVYGTGGYMLSVSDALSYKEDAIGIGRKGTIDKPYILRAPFWTVDTLFYAVPKANNDLQFVNCLFQKVNWKQKNESTGVPSLSKTAINTVQLLTTKTEEQKIIGDFFKELDNLISLYKSKFIKLQKIKKACFDKMTTSTSKHFAYKIQKQ